jgi:RNA-binding motif X-linked protein 2
MNQIKQVQRLNERELEKVVPSNASWHTDYRDTAYIYVGGLHLDLSEGDVITIFSQYGEPVWIRIMRDKETGKSRGFCWLKYEDQRSCDLAVDNLGGATVMGKMLAVDHTRYKKRDDEDEHEGYVGQNVQIAAAPQADESQQQQQEARPIIKEEIELANLMRDMEDDDPMKAYMIEQKKEQIQAALKNAPQDDHDDKDHSRREKRHRHHRHRSRRDRSTSPTSNRHREDDKESDRHRHRSSHKRRSESPRRHRDRSESTRKERHRYYSRDGENSSPRPSRPKTDNRRTAYSTSPSPPTHSRRRDDSRSPSPRPRR